MLFLSFLLFSVIYIDGDNYVKIYRSSNDIDLFFVEQGFFSPAAGFGIVGADMNPAVLGKSDNVEFFAAVSLPGVSASDVDSISIKFEREGGDTVTDEVTLVGDSRLYGQYRSLGGFNFLGFSKRLGMFGVGVSYGAGYKLGVQASLSGSIYGTFQSNKLFEFTSDDFSEIGEDEVISINPEISGGVSIINPVPLRVEYSDAPIFIGGGYSYGPVAVGAGLKFQNCRIMGEGSFSARIDSLAVRVEDTVVIDGDGDDWIIEDFSGELDLDEDLFNGTISSTGLSTMHPVLTLGTLFDFPGMKISLGFDFGGNYDLSGGYSWDFSWVDSLTEDFVSVDSSNLTIIDDSLITGVAVIVIDEMIRDSALDSGSGLTFSGSSFNFSFLLDMPLKVGFNGRLGFPVSDYSLNKLGLCLYSRLPVPGIGVDLGLAADCIFLGGTEVDDFIFIPSATFGLSFSYERDYLGFYLPVKYDASHIASIVLNNVLEDNEDEEVGISVRGSSNIWDNLSFGLGFRVKM
jgi:hypothetical protein